ncbi:MAG: sulfite exporter TauE/SafE family protein [Halobacteriota archaeon]|nr:sulfite exporter TauE/SafE family protein [Halobacteriota archaeon]
MEFFTLLLIFAIAILIGILSSMAGLGGGFLTVPVLVLIFGLSEKNAIGTSTLVITFLGLSSAISYNKKKLLDLGLVIPLAIGALIGAQVGALLTSPLPGEMLRTLLGIVFILVSIFMIFRKDKESDFPYDLSKIMLLISGFLIGIYSGLLGLGGGSIMVPFLNFLGVPIHYAVASSACITFFSGLSGATRHFLLEQVDFQIGLVLSLGVIIGAQIGPNISVRLKPDTLKVFFAFILAIIGVLMLIRP